MQKNCERIIQTLDIELITAQHGQIIQPYVSKAEKITQNRLMYIHKGKITVEIKGQVHHLVPGELLFISSGTIATTTYGNVTSEDTTSDKTTTYAGQPILYFDYKEAQEGDSFNKNFSYIDFSAKAYRAIDFFQFISLPPFIIRNNIRIKEHLNVVFQELSKNKIGRTLVVKGNMVQILACLIRYILSPQVSSHNLAEKLLVKIDALMDLRLVKIFKYISDNMAGTLTNAKIAEQVGLNKDYIGQFFTRHTNMNLQTYIQMVRLNKSLEMLRTTELKVQDISKAVGFSNGAYFGKQFRILFGKPPKQLQTRYIADL